MKLKLKELKNNPYHTGKFDKERIDMLETSIRTLGVLRSFSVFKKGKGYCLVCGHHTREGAIRVLGKDKEVEVTVQSYDDDTAMWGMAVENLTQDRDIKKKIEELDNVRHYLKTHFKTWADFLKFAKEKKIKIGDVEEDKNFLSQIELWLNRDGVIVPVKEIKSLLKIKDNLSPDLFNKMIVGQSNRIKEDKEEETGVFNLTNAKLLSGLGKDHKEQKEVLKALENSITERMYRVRTRGKVVADYKRLKNSLESGKLNEKEKREVKQEIDLIRKGKKDIGNINLPNINLNLSERTHTKNRNAELQDKFRILGNDLELYQDRLPELSVKELEQWLLYLQSWGNNKMADFAKAIIKETAKKKMAKDKGDNNKIVEFNFEVVKGGN